MQLERVGAVFIKPLGGVVGGGEKKKEVGRRSEESAGFVRDVLFSCSVSVVKDFFMSTAMVDMSKEEITGFLLLNVVKVDQNLLFREGCARH